MSHEPRHRLTHLLTYLRWGQQGQIADRLRCDPRKVSAVLNGKCDQNTDLARNIIRLAQERVIRNNPHLRDKLEESINGMYVNHK